MAVVPRVPTVRQRDLDRVVKALKQGGQAVGRVEMRPSGEIVIFPALAASPLDSQVDDLDLWRARRDARSS